MTGLGGLVTRRIQEVALERHQESPVLLMEGPRTVGKSTLLRQLADRLDAAVLDLDDLDTRAAVASDPATMIDETRPCWSTSTSARRSSWTRSRRGSTGPVAPGSSSSPARHGTKRSPAQLGH
ncbi:AAA family ATPase [Nocardioides hungaricus]